MLSTCLAAASAGPSPSAPDNPFDAPVLDVRPRIFLRTDAFDGLTVAKLRQAARTPEFKGIRAAWARRPAGRAILWMLDGKADDLAAAVAGLRRMDASGRTWSDRGLALIDLAALFDWLYPRLDEPTRAATIARLERAADAALGHIKAGAAPYYYSRTPGALAGMTLAGLALKGVSPKADEYLAAFRGWGVGDYFKAYEWVDGAATGSLYTLYYTYVDLPALCAAWWSATGCNPTDWIRRNQGNWLDEIVQFYLWYMRPGFAFTDINDQYRSLWDSQDQFCRGLDIASYVTRNGYGRAWSQRWLAQAGASLYHTIYAHQYIFRDPALRPRPLTDLPRAQLFGRESCGYGFFRSHWPADGQPDDAAHVFFRCGDPMNVHGGVAAGEFQVFKHGPLAARSGRYWRYDSLPDQYHRNCISANVVLLLDANLPGDRGDQNSRRGLKTDHRTWDQWLAIRRRNQLDVASITDWHVGKDEARCRADLTRANPPAKCKQWIRELVWLKYRHLIVLDIVQTARPDTRRIWQLHSTAAPQFAERMITISAAAPRRAWADRSLQPRSQEAKLFCRTLLPRDYTVVFHAAGRAEAFDPAGRSKGQVEGNSYHLKYGRTVIQLEPAGPSDRTLFLHVLTPADGDREPPKSTWRMVGPGRLEVTVDDASTELSVPAWLESVEAKGPGNDPIANDGIGRKTGGRPRQMQGVPAALSPG
jgi:hypothetical protein